MPALPPRAATFARPLLSIAAGLLFAALAMQLAGYHAGPACAALWSGATGLHAGGPLAPGELSLGPLHLSPFTLAQSLAHVTPLLFTGLSVAIALRAGMFNIGSQGQMTLGALAAAVAGASMRGLPAGLHVGLALLAGTAAGAAWGALAGWLKAARGVHEVISTIMLNYVALNLCSYLVTHSLRNPASMAAETAAIAPSAWLTPLVPGANLTAGLPLALAAAALTAFFLRRTALGFETRAVGLSPLAASAAGIPAARIATLAMAISGAMAGAAGAVEALGVHHRYVDGIAGSYGFDGIAVALLGGLTGEGVALAALFFGMLANGAAFMQMQTDVPDSIANVVQAVVILFTAARPAKRALLRIPAIASRKQPDAAL